MLVMDVFTRRIIGFGVERADIDGVSICRMFNCATYTESKPTRLSSDHDPLFRFHRWLANPFVERLIGTVRRECLDHVFFWNTVDLARKLNDFRAYYNAYRVHQTLDGVTPARRAGVPSAAAAKLYSYTWKLNCRGLFRTPIPA